MAQHVHVVLVDDTDGSPASETVSFVLDGLSYEIDVSEANAARLRGAVQEWVQSARRVGGARRRGNRSVSRQATVGASNDTMRRWARANGYTVSDRGRIKADVVEAFNTANS